MPEESAILVNVATLGVVAGMRSQLPLALLSLAARRNRPGIEQFPEFLSSPKISALLLASAAGEIVVDKLPITPSRLMPGSLLVRAGIGGLAGALLTSSTNVTPLRGAAVGAVGALVGSYAGYTVRSRLVSVTGLPDPLFAVLEDATAVAIGSRAVGLTV